MRVKNLDYRDLRDPLDQIGVGFEDRIEFLFAGNRLPLQHPAAFRHFHSDLFNSKHSTARVEAQMPPRDEASSLPINRLRGRKLHNTITINNLWISTVLKQIAKGLPEKVGEGEDQYELRPRVLKDLESAKLWHGNVFQAFNELQGLEMDVEGATFETKDETARKLLKGLEELHTYVERNQEFIPNYGERYRKGERIASGFVESAVNQVMSKRMAKHQQMQWSQRGAISCCRSGRGCSMKNGRTSFAVGIRLFDREPKLRRAIKPPDPRESAGLPRARIHAELGRTVPAGRDDQHGVCGVDDQSGGEPPVCEEAANAVDTARSALAITGADEGPQ
jgi:hypothetical protein